MTKDRLFCSRTKDCDVCRWQKPGLFAKNRKKKEIMCYCFDREWLFLSSTDHLVSTGQHDSGMCELHKSVTSTVCGLARVMENQIDKRKGWTTRNTLTLEFRNGINPEMHPVVSRAVRMEEARS
jgi:hypothetical protein